MEDNVVIKRIYELYEAKYKLVNRLNNVPMKEKDRNKLLEIIEIKLDECCYLAAGLNLKYLRETAYMETRKNIKED